MPRFGLTVAVGAGAFAAAASVCSAQGAPRREISLNSGWTFAFDSAATTGSGRADSVTLPHTWNTLDPTDVTPGYKRGTAFYRRTLDVSGYPRDARLILHFEGANTVAEVLVNGVRAGGHVGGYVGFDIDVTDAVRRDSPNDVFVAVSNADDPDLIPSSRSDFVIYGGLTRNVSLLVLPPRYVAHLSIRTPEVSNASARATAIATIAGPGRTAKTGIQSLLEVRLVDPNGRVAARTSNRVTLTRDSVDVALNLPRIMKPSLWSPQHPALYRLVVTLSGDGASRDSVEERVGFRYYRFAEHGPFFLNGERLLLRGTQRHEERAGIGGAVPDSIDVADIAAIKAMGANFVRLAHYPQAPAVYRAADSLGVLVWDELPWDRGGVGGAAWRENTKQLLREQIRQNENHPSIILWSLGNEVQDVLEPAKAGDTPTLRLFLSELKAIATAMDPSRPTAMRKFDAGADIVDVYSPSIWAGWYRGVYHDYEKALTDAQAKYPRMLHMEYGADAHYGRHTDTPITGERLKLDPGVEEAVGKPVANIARDGDWSESYQSDLLDWHLMVSERQPDYAGGAQWVFRDFATPLRPDNPIPYVNEKGLTTRDGLPKDAWYLYRSYWTTTPRFAYIVSHTWTVRGGSKGKPRTVKVYSNCASVELFANGSSQGTRIRKSDDFPAQGLRWDVGFAEGANTLVARCTGAADGTNVRDSLTVAYTSVAGNRPADIELATRALPDGRLVVEATLVDGKGHRVLDARDRVYFDDAGSGALFADRGTPTGSQVIEAADGCAAIELTPPADGRDVVITARTQELNGAWIHIGQRATPTNVNVRNEATPCR